MMSAIALPRPIAPHRPSSDLSSLGSPMTLDSLNVSPRPPSTPSSHAALPNKHIPVCPPGPVPQEEPTTPPPSPGSDQDHLHRSLLSPPDRYTRLDADGLSIYNLSHDEVSAALDHISRQPMPDPQQVFPWLHGLHPHNQIQQAFFIPRKRVLRRTPPCLRGITVVKAGRDLTKARLKGAIAPHEFMEPGRPYQFLEVDPREGFSVRNFQIQAAKAAMTSDIIVYGDDETAVHNLGYQIAAAQQRWREKHEVQRHPLPTYHTFVCTDPFGNFERHHPEIVAVDSSGRPTGNVLDFPNQERLEMYTMTEASEIAHNVWLGPTPDPATEEAEGYDVMIECSDLGRLDHGALVAIAESDPSAARARHYVDFPSSGSILAPTWSHGEADIILETVKWIHHLAHGTLPPPPSTADGDGDVAMAQPSPSTRPRKILIHCADGYTESTLLGIAYFSFATGRPVPDAWMALHTTMRRNFFAYPSDVALLTAIAPRLLHESPALAGASLADITALVRDEPRWFAGFDGSFPSRILDYMYLGNLGHANNPDLLRALGIGQILSVGEMAMWRDGELDEWGEDNTCVVQCVQDNGIDPLTDEFERCLEFIDRGRRKGTATLVHCRVGVSRSATICIAEVMRELDMSFPRAYCFVRARRLNVIIQPHLRFAYELLKWEELLQAQKSAGDDRCEAGLVGVKRELEWGEIAREVALMNRPYAR
ncbi:putative dual specificity protein phosphatase [Podospora conica]|nr:putative dual specificity protein phosphatase [Schizothecium conicum]